MNAEKKKTYIELAVIAAATLFFGGMFLALNRNSPSAPLSPTAVKISNKEGMPAYSSLNTSQGAISSVSAPSRAAYSDSSATGSSLSEAFVSEVDPPAIFDSSDFDESHEAASNAGSGIAASTGDSTGGVGGGSSGGSGSSGGPSSAGGSGSSGGMPSSTSDGSPEQAEGASEPGTDTSGTDDEAPPTDEETSYSGGGSDFDSQEAWLESKLSSLKSLPKVHYSWGLWYYQLLGDPDDSRFYHLARITHAFCVAGGSIGPHQIDIAVYACAKVNRTNPSTPASIGVNFSPYHYRFGKDLPPTDRGPTYQAELAYLEERMNLVKEWVRASNMKYGSDVRISAVLLDSERWCAKTGDIEWNAGMREALDEVHQLVQRFMPDVRIEWYSRGMKLESATWTPTGYTGGKLVPTEYWTGNEHYIPSLSCSLYTLPDENNTRPRLFSTCELAARMGVPDVTPWVALAAGYKPNIALSKNVWADDWDFDLNLSHKLGKDLNSNKPPYDYVKVVTFFPAPFYTNSPAWAKHFIAYVRGATGVDDLSDLELNE